jgi:hypothetical protein
MRFSWWSPGSGLRERDFKRKWIGLGGQVVLGIRTGNKRIAGFSLRQGIGEEVSIRVGLPVLFVHEARATMGAKLSVRQQLNPLKISAAVQPDCDGPNGSCAVDDEVRSGIVIDIGYFNCQSGQVIRNVRVEPKLRASGREVNADLIERSALPDCCCFRNMVAIQIPAQLCLVREPLSEFFRRCRGNGCAGQQDQQCCQTGYDFFVTVQPEDKQQREAP